MNKKHESIRQSDQQNQTIDWRIRSLTPARIFVDQAQSAYSTSTQLTLRQDHAAARDAVHAEVDLQRDFGREIIARFGIFEVASTSTSKSEYLMRPDRGRRLSDSAVELVRQGCPPNCDIQVVIGDGLSALAVAKQVPKLLGLLEGESKARSWTFGRPFFVRYCRVGIMNDVGAWLNPKVLLLLIGERPGLATAESLSVYMAYRPKKGHTDADRNLVSNIHDHGVAPQEAARRVMALAETMMQRQLSGTNVKEKLSLDRGTLE